MKEKLSLEWNLYSCLSLTNFLFLLAFKNTYYLFPVLTLFLPRVTPLSSQNVVIHHGQTQEYVLKPKYFAAQKVISGEQSTEGSFPLRYGPDQVAAPFQCEYRPASHLSKL